jgi:pyruvate dehydrogenase E1 component alpha subunit
MLTRARLLDSGAASAEELEALEERIASELADLLDRVRRDPLPDPATARDHVFAGGAA